MTTAQDSFAFLLLGLEPRTRESLLRSLEQIHEFEFRFSLAEIEDLDEDLLLTHEDGIILDEAALDDESLAEFVSRVQARMPGHCVLVIGSGMDSARRYQALEAGAKEVVDRDNLDHTSLLFVVRYVLQREKLLRELAASRERESQERELRKYFEQALSDRSSMVTARSFGLIPLKDSFPEYFRECLEEFGAIVEISMESKLFKAGYQAAERMTELAHKLVAVQAGPRDIVEMFTVFMDDKRSTITKQRFNAFMNEGKMVLLQLMGEVAGIYRNMSLGAWSSSQGNDGVN
jgi:DNA-binding NarL/FixJ family response regulator